MLVFNGAQPKAVILNGVSTTGYLNGAVIWGESVPRVFIPSNFYFSSNNYVKNQGASGSATLSAGQLFYISGTSNSGIGFDTAFINSATSPTSNYWALGASSVGMRFTASARLPASGLDMRNMKTGYKVLMFGKTQGTGSWTGLRIASAQPNMFKNTVVSSTISGADGYTLIKTAYASAGSSDTKGFYKIASSNANTRYWQMPAGALLTRFSGAFSGNRTATADTYTYTMVKAGASVVGSSRLAYGELGNFTQAGVYTRQLGSAIGTYPVSAQVSSTPASFNGFTTGGVAWSAMARVP